MKLKHTVNFIKKHTVAIFVKVEKEEPKVCTFNEEYIKLFNSLVKDKYYTPSTPFAFGFASNTRVIFITYREMKNYMYETWKNAGASLIKIMKDLHIDDIEVDMAELFAEIASEESYIQFCLGMILSSYSFDNYLGDKRLKEKTVIKNILLVSGDKKDTENADGYYIPKYNSQIGKYEYSPYGDTIRTDYAIDTITKNNDKYNVKLVEYSVQRDLDKNADYDYAVFKYNETTNEFWKNWEKVFELERGKSGEKEEIRQKVLEQKDKFLSYNFVIEKNDIGSFNAIEFKKVSE